MRKSRPQTKVTKDRISKSLKKYFPPFIRSCPDCKVKIEYQDRHSFRKAERGNCVCFKCKVKKDLESGLFSRNGKKSALSQHRRSYNEIYFAQLCKRLFDNVETNKAVFNGWDADVIIHDKKIAILWNGKWHYKKITQKHSVKQVQNRDKIKLKEIRKCGYIPYIVKDMGGKNFDFVEKTFEKFCVFLLTL